MTSNSEDHHALGAKLAQGHALGAPVGLLDDFDEFSGFLPAAVTHEPSTGE